uniref:Uncharacterized protein LOC111108073 n=1 Tax=Crassostrea virginica TaxID=6565 RepID=A0A8B8B995_CRAVI|nr:uncharacterized protein LOC111108073 [Crassostrea virginica]
MEIHAVKHVNVRTHHVIMSMGALACGEATLEKKTTIFWTFTGTTNTTPERKAERDTDSKDIRTITGYLHFENILVILAGMASSLSLLLTIARTIFKLFRMSETSGNSHAAMDTPVVNNTSGDITESLYYSIGTKKEIQIRRTKKR